MRAMKLSQVRKHTGQKLSYEQACKIVNRGDVFLRNMAAALSLMTWLNTPSDWLRLEAALVVIHHRPCARRRSRR